MARHRRFPAPRRHRLRRRAVLGIPLGLTLGWYPAANQVVNPRDADSAAHQSHRLDSGSHHPSRRGRPCGYLPHLSGRLLSHRRGLRRWRIQRALGLPPRRPQLRPRAARLLTRVVFPAALPKIIVGLRIALGIAWLVVVAAEMVAVDSGLGYLVIDSRNSGKRYDLVVAAMLIIGLIGLVLDTGFRRLEKIKSVRWGFRDES